MSYKLSSHFGNYHAGLHNVGSYQVSGTPLITGSLTMNANSEDRIGFPMVSKSFTVINRSSGDYDLRVHFNSQTDPQNDANPTEGVVTGLRYITVERGESFTFDVKCKQFYISTPGNAGDAAYQVLVELTSIPTSSMFVLTGSGYTHGSASFI